MVFFCDSRFCIICCLFELTCLALTYPTWILLTVGTKEADPCAARGTCSSTDGTCTCFNSNGDAYGSSNGYGDAGQRGDCG